MSKIRSFLLAILVVITTLFGTACESEEETDEPPQVRDSGTQGGEDAPLDQDAGAAGELAGESGVAGDEALVAGDLVETSGTEVAGETIAGEEVICQAIPVCEEGSIEVVDCEGAEDPADCVTVEICDEVIFCQEVGTEPIPEPEDDDQQ